MIEDSGHGSDPPDPSIPSNPSITGLHLPELNVATSVGVSACSGKKECGGDADVAYGDMMTVEISPQGCTVRDQGRGS